MRPLPTQCPICGGETVVTGLHCRSCDSTITGRFASGPLAGLTADQMNFVLTFLRCEGKFTRMEGEMGMSYPTLRNRLHELIRDLGFEPGEDESARLDDASRRQVLEDLEAGKLSPAEAVLRLKGDDA